VLFGSALLGVIGALVAIPVAASIQIAIREWWAWRLEEKQRAGATQDVTTTTGPRPDPPTTPPEAAPA